MAFAEGPRWHRNTLWWSDMHGHGVWKLAGRSPTRVCEVPMHPSGLGWLPDGRLLVVSMTDRRVLRREGDGTLVVHADLAALAPRRCNDMLVDADGRAYVGNFGFEIGDEEPPEKPQPTVLIAIEKDGAARVVADDLWFPNGMVILPGGVLVVAETWAARLTAFDIAANGDLRHRRVWAGLAEDVYPDGICLAGGGDIWVASASTRECLKISEGGAISGRVGCEQNVYACALGGHDGRTLYLCVADSHDPLHQRSDRNGRILAVRT